MSAERPEALLKSALEKIIYFEARAEQVQAELSAAKAEVEGLKQKLEQSSRTELELRQKLAEIEVSNRRLVRAHEEEQKTIDALKTQRTELIGKLIEASRIHEAGGGDAQEEFSYDLASFIAVLRGEVLERQMGSGGPAIGQPPDASPSPAASCAEPAEAVAVHARRMLAEGRLSEVSPQPRAEDNLLAATLRELVAEDPAARIRAAERLKALGHRSSADVLASLLGSEPSSEVLHAFLDAYAHLGNPDRLGPIEHHLKSRDDQVRLSALKAILFLAPQEAAAHFAAAMEDASPAVRRRASMLALGLAPDAAVALARRALTDLAPAVRRVGALALAASARPEAQALLLAALDDGDERVRSAAAKSLSARFGDQVLTVAHLEPAARRRAIRRISAASPRPEVAASTTPSLPPSSSQVSPIKIDEKIKAALVAQVRASIRGKAASDLASSIGQSVGSVEGAAEALVASGQLVRRGAKYFVA